MEVTKERIQEITAALNVSVKTVDRLIDTNVNNVDALIAANAEIEKFKQRFAEIDGELATALTPVLDSIMALNEKALASLPTESVESPIIEPPLDFPVERDLVDLNEDSVEPPTEPPAPISDASSGLPRQ